MKKFCNIFFCLMVLFPLAVEAGEYKNVAVFFEFYKSDELVDSGFLMTTAENDRVSTPVSYENKPARGYPVVDCKKDGKGGTFKSEIVSPGSEILVSGNKKRSIKIRASFYELDSSYVMPDTSDIDLIEDCRNVEAPKVIKYSQSSIVQLDNSEKNHVIKLGGGYTVNVQIRAVEA